MDPNAGLTRKIGPLYFIFQYLVVFAMNILVTTVLMEMGHGVAMGTVFGTRENVKQNQSIKLDQSKMILVLKVIMYMALFF